MGRDPSSDHRRTVAIVLEERLPLSISPLWLERNLRDKTRAIGSPKNESMLDASAKLLCQESWGRRDAAGHYRSCPFGFCWVSPDKSLPCGGAWNMTTVPPSLPPDTTLDRTSIRDSIPQSLHPLKLSLLVRCHLPISASAVNMQRHIHMTGLYYRRVHVVCSLPTLYDQGRQTCCRTCLPSSRHRELAFEAPVGGG